MKLLGSAIASGTAPGGEDTAADIVVLDDVTPRYASINAALSTCNSGLGAALHILQNDTRTGRRTGLHRHRD